MKEICLPQFGMGMTEGLITKWHKSVGDPIKEGELLCEIETAKTTVEMQVPFSGILTTILIPAEQSVPVNTRIALVDDGLAGAELDQGTQVVNPRPRVVVAAKDSTARTATQVEPRARNLARAHSVELTAIRGSGPAGRVIEQDVLDVIARLAGKSPPR
jgi:pyruvate/2-oxoglutarate dehydrogenase complex dihydrolipoamide acyltransferase (E2) component